MDLKTKLAFALVSASLLSMLALGYFTYLWTADLFLEDSRRQLNAVAESRKHAIDRTLARWKLEVEALVERARAAQPDGPLERGNPAGVERVVQALRAAQASSEDLRQVTLFDVRGKPLARTAGAQPAALGVVPEDDVAFSGVRVEPGHGIGVVLHAWLTQRGQRVGILEAVFAGRALGGIVGPAADLGETGQTLLLVPARSGPTPAGDADGVHFLVSASSRGVEVERRSGPEAPAASAALRGREQLFPRVGDHRGREVMAASRALSEAGWGLVVQIDDAEVHQRADQLLANMRDLGVSLAAFAVLGGTLLGLQLGRPIHKLVEEVDRIRHGELGLRLQVEGEDEVAFLAMSLNEFMDQLDRSSDLFRLGELDVLLVDADAENRRLLGDLLENWNMRPTLAESASAALEALEQASRAGQPLQLALLDAALPDVEVLRLAEQLRSASAGSLPIILLSADAEAPDADRLRQAGIGRSLPKPVVASHLMEAILDEMGVSAEGLAATTDAYLKKAEPRKILLVEDNALMQRVILDFLENWGHQVTLAENGRIAVDSIRGERFDLVLMDVEMPEMNGLDATRAIRAHEREGAARTPIVALTAEARAGDRERCLAAGMDDYISKPVDPKALYAMIERHPGQLLASRPPDAAQPPRAAARAPSGDEAGAVDWDVARSLTGGDERLLGELIEIFPEESRRQLDAMRRGLEDRDAELLTRSAHSLKSTAQVFGATRLAEAALAMETLGRSAELADAGPLLETLESETRRLTGALANRGVRPA